MTVGRRAAQSAHARIKSAAEEGERDGGRSGLRDGGCADGGCRLQMDHRGRRDERKCSPACLILQWWKQRLKVSMDENLLRCFTLRAKI